MKFIIKNIFISILLLFLFVGCGKETKKKMGIVNTPPDEFQVYKQKSLSVPPNFDLRAPDSDELNIKVIEDKDLLFNDEEKVQLSVNDEILLMTLGKDKINSNIRKIINEDNSLEDVDKSTIDKILDFEPVFEAEKEDEVLDPEAEKRRLEEIRAEIQRLEAGLEEVEDPNQKNVETENEKESQAYENTTTHSIATEGEVNKAPKNNKNASKEEKSLLDEILDFEIFGSEDEEVEAQNQRDSTYFEKKKIEKQSKKKDKSEE